MTIWTWFLAPPAAFLAAYTLGPSLIGQPAPLPPPPAVQALQLSPALLAAAQRPALPAPHHPDAQPRDIRLAAFGIIVPTELARVPARAVVPPAHQLFRLDSVLVAGEQRLAAINGDLFRVGDRVSRRYRLQAIEPDVVWLAGPRGREALRFPEWRDAPPPVPLAAPPVALQPAQRAQPSTPANPAGMLESEYRKILEMLKL